MQARLNSPTSAIYTHDNLPILRGLNSHCIDLIYLDPPFNTGKQWHAPIGEGGSKVGFSDIWGWDRVTGETLAETIERQWEEERDYAGTAVREVVEAAVAAHGPQMGSYCAWMAPRLIEMQRVLKDTGSIYLHCDPFAGAYLKALMDAIFGSGAFRSEISWKRQHAHSDARQGRKQHGRIYDRLLFYTAGKIWTWNPIYTEYDQEYVDRFYCHTEEETGRRYRLDNLLGPGGAAKGNPRYEVMGVTRYWRYSREKMATLIAEGRVIQRRPGNVPMYKRYLDEMPGVLLQDFWPDIKPVAPRGKERQGYPTQKPLALLERVIATSSNPGDVVLDPFCGCATACVAAQKLERRWIGIDVEPEAVTLCRRRLANELGFDGITEERHTPPTRTDERQLELIPHNRAVRFELWQKMQQQQQCETPPCEGCGRAPGLEYMEVDHIVPRSRGGEHVWSNVQLLCGPCNRSKGNKTWAAWKREARQKQRAGAG